MQVGKTSLINALKYGHSPPIGLHDRTVAVQVSKKVIRVQKRSSTMTFMFTQVLEDVDLRIWDFAGHALADAVHLLGELAQPAEL